MGFTTSFRQLRQWILHGKVLVNLVPVKNFNYQIEPGNIISIKESKKASVNLKLIERIEKKSIISMRPQHLEISSKILAGVLLFKPQQIYYPTPAKLARFSRRYNLQIKKKLPLKKQTKSKLCRKINNMTVFQRPKKHLKVRRRKWRFTFLKTIKRNKKKWYVRSLFRAPKAKILKFFSPELAIS
jgi:ribosomal protein S4